MNDFIEIATQTPSEQLRTDLKAEGKPVLLAFSRGKDSIAAWLALQDSGVTVIPYHMYLIPKLKFVDDSLAYFEDLFGQHIINVPHPSLYRWLNYNTFQPPERLTTIAAARLPNVTYEHVVGLLRKEFAEPETWVVDGVRAADSPVRRMSIMTHGAVKAGTRKMSAIWDWRKHHVMDRIHDAGIEMPVDYAWFGRSFDGVDLRFLGPLHDHAPDDYQRVLDWVPLADLELFRAHR